MTYININHRNKINVYNQHNPVYNGKFASSCAFVCAAMVLKTDPETLSIKCSHTYADWSCLFGNTEIRVDESNGVSLSYILDKLKQGYPVVARSKRNQHWVVIYAYEGLDNVVQAMNFRCIDPVGGTDCYLPNSWGYERVEKTVIDQ